MWTCFGEVLTLSPLQRSSTIKRIIHIALLLCLKHFRGFNFVYSSQCICHYLLFWSLPTFSLSLNTPATLTFFLYSDIIFVSISRTSVLALLSTWNILPNIFTQLAASQHVGLSLRSFPMRPSVMYICQIPTGHRQNMQNRIIWRFTFKETIYKHEYGETQVIVQSSNSYQKPEWRTAV